MRFSIVIPVYNVAPYLRECLDSLLGQDETGWHAVCVDDGSTDGSTDVLDEYSERDSRFEVIHQENAGVSAARNAALDRAEGEWVVFLDADDVLAPCTLSHVLTATQKSPLADVIAFKTRRFNDGEVPTLSEGLDFTVLGDLIDSRRELDVKNALCDFAGKAYRRRVIGNVRFKPYVVGEDQLFMLEVMLASSWTQEITSVLYGYRQRATSAVHTNVTKRKIADMVAYNFDELTVIDQVQKRVSAAFIRIVANWLTEGVSYRFFDLSREDRRELWPTWRESLERAVHFRRLPWVQKLRLMLFRGAPFCYMAKLIFYFPVILKMRGLHR